MSKSVNILTLYLPVPSADNFCKQFMTQIRPDKNVGPDLDPICLSLNGIPERILKKK